MSERASMSFPLSQAFLRLLNILPTAVYESAFVAAHAFVDVHDSSA